MEEHHIPIPVRPETDGHLSCVLLYFLINLDFNELIVIDKIITAMSSNDPKEHDRKKHLRMYATEIDNLYR